MKQKLLLVLLLGVIRCSPPSIPDPESAMLIAPENLDSCTTAFSLNGNQSQVTFRWGQALHADAYELIVTNSLTGQQTKEQTALQTINLVLDKGYPYAWKVLSLSDASLVETSSASWHFYLEANPSESHLPFATLLQFPEDEETVALGDVTFRWEGNDLDSTRLVYDFYFGESPDELQLNASALATDSFTLSINFTGTYYWKVDTIDEVGNRASSQPFLFRVE